jgi:hypothetical protein
VKHVLFCWLFESGNCVAALLVDMLSPEHFMSASILFFITRWFSQFGLFNFIGGSVVWIVHLYRWFNQFGLFSFIGGSANLDCSAL